MSVASEITRLQNAKASLKTSINAKTDTQHQITDETIDNYSNFVDSITSGGGGTDWSLIGYESEPEGFTIAFNYAKEIYDNWNPDISGCASKYSGNTEIKIMPNVDVSRPTTFNSMFYNATSLIIVPPFNCSRGSTFQQMFQGCTAIQSIPQIDTHTGSTFQQMFYQCSKLKNIAELDFSKATRIESMLVDCGSLTNVGGFKNLGKSYSTSQSANYNRYKLNATSPELTHDSMMNIINKVYDIATRGCATQLIYFGATNLEKLTAEEIAIATNKGWTVS